MFGTLDGPRRSLRAGFDDESHASGTSGAVLAASTTLVFLVFIFLPSCYFYFNRRGRHSRTGPGGASSPTGISEDEEQKYALRYNTVEAWLISKRVHAHDEVCEAFTGGGDIGFLLPARKEKEDILTSAGNVGDDEMDFASEKDGGDKGDRECPSESLYYLL